MSKSSKNEVKLNLVERQLKDNRLGNIENANKTSKK